MAEYEWIRTPRDDEGPEALAPVPESVIEFLRALDRGSGSRYVAGARPSAPVARTNALDARTNALNAQTNALDAQTSALNAPVNTRTTTKEPETLPATTREARDCELMAQALRAARVRAGTARVGFPVRVVELSEKRPERPEVFGVTASACAVRIEFSHQSGTSRVCPVTRMEHESNHFFVTLGADSCTGLPAFFMYCHSVKDCNAEKKHEMLAFVDPASFEAIGVDAEAVGAYGAYGAEVATPAAVLSIGQSAVLLGKMQAQVDRLIENPGGAWDTVVNVGEVACALCTAASKHPAALALAREMLGQLLAASQMSEDEKEHAARGFQHAKTTLDPLMKVKGLAEGLAGKREQELMVIREAIAANS